eukprot:GDKI01002556.1.p1 GENE.GDKI01002556.1~~GDKI01002556.1.p1  ORF type:complete len:149 (+),score=39.07 GDKI01002556.1:47-448(+)
MQNRLASGLVRLGAFGSHKNVFAPAFARFAMTQVESVTMFKDKVKASKGLVVAQYSASWCGPCRHMKPIVEKMSQDNASVDFLYVDIDEHGALAEEADVTGVPTFVFLKNGKVLEKLVGANPEKLKDLVTKYQ